MLINDLLIGGAERAFVAQANSLIDKDCKVVFVVLNKNKIDFDFKKTLDQQITFYQLSMSSLWQISQLKYLLNTLRKLNVDVIYSTLDNANIIARICKIFIPRLRVVIRESGMADRKSFAIKMVDLILNNLVNYIIAVSPAVYRSLINYQPIHKNKIKIIENGVSIPPPFSKSLKFPIKLLHIGSMSNKNKNQSYLIDVLSYILKTKPNLSLELVFVGDGKLRNQLVAYTKHKNVENNITFMGQIQPKELTDIFIQSDIFVFASKSEGSPNAILEAMSYGLPIVAVDIDSIKSIIKDNETGLLVEANDILNFSNKLVELINNIEIRKILGNNARELIVKNYSIDVVSGKVKQLLCH